ncbi:SRPBCC family protein [Alkalicoccus halolimnae]|uniref:SRPBCC family protein n=1 Tax=Alkalicoccus halolimnae TaxID=1667239 RepID=A0A5C7F806_9BACI|nr:SRPBCC family protein [Alkalicoccus halolimnae]TXF86812.1 SRPBCC family protein [Alkalicoccus halolimnae]
MEWKEKTLVPTHIEVVWNIFQDQYITKLMPKVVEHKLIEGKADTIGARHRQTSRDGKKTETHIVETTQYIDEPSRKEKELHFLLDNAFEVKLRFILVKINENETELIYEGYQKPVNLKGKLKQKLSTTRARKHGIQKFVQHIMREAGA